MFAVTNQRRPRRSGNRPRQLCFDRLDGRLVLSANPVAEALDALGPDLPAWGPAEIAASPETILEAGSAAATNTGPADGGQGSDSNMGFKLIRTPPPKKAAMQHGSGGVTDSAFSDHRDDSVAPGALRPGAGESQPLVPAATEGTLESTPLDGPAGDNALGDILSSVGGASCRAEPPTSGQDLIDAGGAGFPGNSQFYARATRKFGVNLGEGEEHGAIWAAEGPVPQTKLLVVFFLQASTTGVDTTDLIITKVTAIPDVIPADGLSNEATAYDASVSVEPPDEDIVIFILYGYAGRVGDAAEETDAGSHWVVPTEMVSMSLSEQRAGTFLTEIVTMEM